MNLAFEKLTRSLSAVGLALLPDICGDLIRFKSFKRDYSNALGTCSVDRQPMKRKRAALEWAWQIHNEGVIKH